MKHHGELKEQANNIKNQKNKEINNMNEMTLIITKEMWEKGQMMLEEKIKKNPLYMWESRLEDDVMCLRGGLSIMEEEINLLSNSSNNISLIDLCVKVLSFQETADELVEVILNKERTLDDLMRVEGELFRIEEEIDELEKKIDELKLN
ncbi:hypothetical protein [Mesobacillus jeotgali]|uniref:hypothetical protein n=1 Tax=Mesobacillus jeotgali TaxID=129985 RepID=UPI000C8160AB|nr:hypothetical protein [Mesobacillus jeotgali]